MRHAVMLASVVAVTGLVPVLPAAGTPPQAAVVSRTVTDWLTAPGGGVTSAATTWRPSAPIATPDAVMVAADWGGDHDVTVEVRAQRDGAWGAWTPLHPSEDHAPDPGTAEASRAREVTTSDPVWTGPADALQVRTMGAPAELPVELHTVTVRGGDGLAYRPAATPASAAHAAPSQPTIITREQWGADESLRVDHPPSLADDVRFAVVHHTAGSNDYDCATQSDDVVRAIYAFHTQTRGWDDIAYNFLIDRCGQVFEGRAGGITEAVVGAHTAGWNGGSTGVSVMGDFTSVQPTAQTKDALTRLLGWKLDLHHVDPFGTTDEVAGGGGTNRYESGDRVTLPTIIGHRDTNETSCPGRYLYDWLFPASGTTIRDRVAATGTPKIYGGLPSHREQPVAGIRPRWEASFTEAMSWRLTIHDADGALVRSTGGYGASGVDVTWDLTDIDGTPVDPGTYRAELRAWSSTAQATPVLTDLEITGPVDRYAGEDRVTTALELSRWAFTESTRVVLATSVTYADALSASPLAGSFGAPVLLTPPDRLPDVVVDELLRLSADEVWIIGGTSAVSDQVAEDLVERAGIPADEVHRLAGADRYATSYLVADEVLHREESTEAVVALGRHDIEDRAFPDALSAGAFGAQFDLPIVLVEGTTLPDSSRRFFEEHRLPDGVRIFGGTSAIEPSVEQAIASSSGAPVLRFAGADRYDTSRMAAEEVLARWAQQEQEEGPDPYLVDVGLEVVVASGRNWPDALGAGAAAAERDRSVFLLTSPEGVPSGGATARFLEEHAADISHGVISGGEVAVSSQAADDLAAWVLSDGPHTAPQETWPPDPHADGGPGLPVQ